MATIRLYISTPLHVGQETELDEEKSHYLINVMKLATGESFYGFDGVSGEYEIYIEKASKKHCQIKVLKQTKAYQDVPDIWLLFAPIKKDNTDFIIQKSVELGIKQIFPVITQHTISDKVRLERLQAQAIEAAEQCRRVDVPLVHSAQSLEQVLHTWDTTRPLLYMDETQRGRPAQEVFCTFSAPVAFLVGPEGGFSENELKLLRSLAFCHGVTLGPRILRAETAAVAALSCWQVLSGDWIIRGEQ